MTRERGYYWCKFEGEWLICSWEPSWRKRDEWALPGCELYKEDDFFDEIDERQIVREKPKMSKEQITKAEELISDTIRKVDKLFGLL